MSRWIEIRPGAEREIRDQLFEQGVEFPCGGETLCGGCRIRVIEGHVPVTPEMRDVLTEAELAAGWRLACLARVTSPVKIAVEQWSAPVLSDEATVAFEPRDGFGAVIDLGTTTLVVQVVNLTTGEVEATRTALNPQARHGADIMTRIQFDLANPGLLRAMIRESLGAMLAEAAGGRSLREVWMVGNTVMHHLFCGESVEPLAAVPFRPTELGMRVFAPDELGWNVEARFLGCAGGFVGSDLVVGLVAVGILDCDRDIVLMDLGTNGEIAVGNREHVRCASTAAGPAFEAGRIQGGMRAGRGAIDRVDARDGRFECQVMGGVEAAGICGSGLVDAVAAALELGCVNERGRVMTVDRRLALRDGIELRQSDIRELQLAKGAVAAGLRMLATREYTTIHLAGAFGNYVRVESAKRIGLIPAEATAHPAGNTALRGARMLLLAPSTRDAVLNRLMARLEHAELAADPEFQEVFAESMSFSR